MAEKKEQLMVRIDSKIAQAFRAKCERDEITQADAMRNLITLYANDDITVKRKVIIEMSTKQ